MPNRTKNPSPLPEGGQKRGISSIRDPDLVLKEDILNDVFGVAT